MVGDEIGRVTGAMRGEGGAFYALEGPSQSSQADTIEWVSASGLMHPTVTHPPPVPGELPNSSGSSWLYHKSF